MWLVTLSPGDVFQIHMHDAHIFFGLSMRVVHEQPCTSDPYPIIVAQQIRLTHADCQLTLYGWWYHAQIVTGSKVAISFYSLESLGSIGLEGYVRHINWSQLVSQFSESSEWGHPFLTDR